MKFRLSTLVFVIFLLARFEGAYGADFEPLGKAISAALGGGSKASKKTVNSGGQNVDVFFTRGAGGKPERLAFVQKGIYEPNCTHTWVVGVDAATAKVEQVRVVEMSCPHAFPTRSPGFLDQFKGKGPADVAKLDSEVMTIAKATGSSKLATDAVKRSIRAAVEQRGKL